MKTDNAIIVASNKKGENLSYFYGKQIYKFSGQEYKDAILQCKEDVEEIKQELGDKFTIKVYDGNTNHICKYCADVAEGTYEDLLCDDCREIFGHSLYSEL